MVNVHAVLPAKGAIPNVHLSVSLRDWGGVGRNLLWRSFFPINFKINWRALDAVFLPFYHGLKILK